MMYKYSPESEKSTFLLGIYPEVVALVSKTFPSSLITLTPCPCATAIVGIGSPVESSIGAFGFGLSQILFLYILLKAIRYGDKAEDKQWDGADSLEWTHLPSPAPYHSFEEPPQVK